MRVVNTFAMIQKKYAISLFLWLALAIQTLCPGVNAQVTQGPAGTPQPAPAAPQESILVYIKNAWNTLGRSMNECSSIVDPKFGAGAEAVLYLPHDGPVPPAVVKLQKECKVDVERLPRPIKNLGDVMPEGLKVSGLLYLPNRYVVPGGRFNEMYGWDSYFIIRGLLEDGERGLARGIVENFFYEIENYGAVLNANRTYYLTRSQPPFLTSMILSVYAADKAAGQADTKWLAKAYDYAVRDHNLWTRDPKLAGDTGMARYCDVGNGPVPDIADHPEYYASIADWLLRHPDVKTDYIAVPPSDGIGPDLMVPLCDRKPCSDAHAVKLTADFYKGDRAMRESGFDPSFRWGPFDGSTHHYAPICLNSLLFKAENDLAQMATMLGKPDEAKQWSAQAESRKKAINQLLWSGDKGMFFDWDFMAKQQSNYNYVTTFYPIWVGLATPQQAKALKENLGLFDYPGGLAMSDRTTGVQWDLPFGWAPTTLIAVEGLRKYGFNAEADNISRQFLTNVLDNYKHDGTIREKYDVVNRTTEANVIGYHENLVGFGWTNGAFLSLLHAMPQSEQQKIVGGAKAKAAGAASR
jgi:alpha,alpha-trehalase